MALPTIFVAVASYRDPECQYTVRDLFEKAAHPGRISVGICWQADPEKDGDCFLISPPLPAQVREKRYLPWESKGGAWARVEALSLAQGEDYILQIDAHMRFEQNWDEILLEVLARCPARKAALTTSPPPYIPPNHCENMVGRLSVSFVLEAHTADSLQPVSIGGAPRLESELHAKGPLPVPFLTANFLFAPRAMFEEVPCDPYIFFRGQESCYSLRLFTHGWNLYNPDKQVAYHYWESRTRQEKNDPSGDYKGHPDRAIAAHARVWHILGITPAKHPESLPELEKYGQGNKRQAADFWKYSGVDLKLRSVADFARRGEWPPQPE